MRQKMEREAMGAFMLRVEDARGWLRRNGLR
jgi:hypothetical protein